MIEKKLLNYVRAFSGLSSAVTFKGRMMWKLGSYSLWSRLQRLAKYWDYYVTDQHKIVKQRGKKILFETAQALSDWMDSFLKHLLWGLATDSKVFWNRSWWRCRWRQLFQSSVTVPCVGRCQLKWINSPTCLSICDSRFARSFLVCSHAIILVG